jgi:hypothetical protein
MCGEAPSAKRKSETDVGVSSLNWKLPRNISLLLFASFCTHKSTRVLTQISGGHWRTSTIIPSQVGTI